MAEREGSPTMKLEASLCKFCEIFKKTGNLSYVRIERFIVSGFNLTTRDSYFTILAEVYFSSKHIFYEPYRVKRTQDSYRQFPPSFLYQAKVL